MERASRRLASRLATRSELSELSETWSHLLKSSPRTRSVWTTPCRSSSGQTSTSPAVSLMDKLKQTLSSFSRSVPQGVSNVRLPALPNLPSVPSLPSPTKVRTAMAYHIASLYERYHKPVFSIATLTLSYTTYAITQALMVKVLDPASSATWTVPAMLALTVVAAALTAYLRHCTIRPDAVYRKAMMQLNAHPGVLEILGAPVIGSSTRASVVQGGGLVVEGGKLRMAPKRVDMVWELTGGYRGRSSGGIRPAGGVVSVEGVKKGGQLQLKVLALDVERPGAATGRQGVGEERVYVLGGLRDYEASNILHELKAVVAKG